MNNLVAFRADRETWIKIEVLRYSEAIQTKLMTISQAIRTAENRWNLLQKKEVKSK